jgi:hypothetical protein
MHNPGADGTRGTNQSRHLKLCLPMGTMAANWNGDFGTSPFFVGSSSDKSVLASINGRAGDKEQGVTRGPRTRIFAVGDGPSILASPIRQRHGLNIFVPLGPRIYGLFSKNLWYRRFAGLRGGPGSTRTSSQSIIGAGHNVSTGLPGQEERACGTGMTPETSVP